MKNLIDLKFNISGEILIQKFDKKTNLLIEEKTVKNLFLDQGVRFWGNGYAPNYLRIGYKTNPVVPSYTDTDIQFDSGKVWNYSVTRTYETSTTYRRHKFVTGNISVGTTTSYNSIGLFNNSYGTYCYSILDTPITVNTNEIIVFTYFLYFNNFLPNSLNLNDPEWAILSFKEIFMNIGSLSTSGCYYIFLDTPYLPKFRHYETMGNSGYIYNTFSSSKYSYKLLTSFSSLSSNIGYTSTVGISINNYSSYYVNNAYYSFLNNKPMKGRIFCKKETSSQPYNDSDVNYQANGYPYAIDYELNENNLLFPYRYVKIYPLNNGRVGTTRYYLKYTNSSFLYTRNRTQDDPASGNCGWTVFKKIKINNMDYYVFVGASNWLWKYGYYLLPQKMIEDMAFLYVDIGSTNYNYNGVVHNQSTVNKIYLYRLYSSVNPPFSGNYNFYTITFESSNFPVDRTPTLKSYVFNGNKNVGYSFMTNSGEIYILFSNEYFLKKLDLTDENNPILSDTNICTLPGQAKYNEKDGNIYNIYAACLQEISVEGTPLNSFSGIGDIQFTPLLDQFSICSLSNTDVLTDMGKLELESNNTQIRITLPKNTNITYNNDASTYVGLYFYPGDCEVICKFSNFNPTTNYQALGLTIRNLKSYNSFKGIFFRYNNGKKIETISATPSTNNIEGSISFAGMDVWFKIKRESDIITCYYSTDGINFTLLGNNTFTLPSTESFVITACGTTFGQNITTQISGLLDQFTVISGNVNRTVKCNFINDYVIATPDLDRTDHSPFLVKNGKKFVLGRNRLIELDSQNGPIIRYTYPTKYVYGAFMDYEDTDKFIYLKFSNNPTNSNDVYLLTYHIESDKFINIPNYFSNAKYINYIHTRDNGIIYRDGTTANFYIYYPEITFDWNEILSRWELIEPTIPESSINGKLTHSDFQEIPFGPIIRFNDYTQSPDATFSDQDVYTFDYCKYGIVKDNLQTISNLGIAVYVGDVKFVENEIQQIPATSPYTITLSKKDTEINWLTADFDWKSRVLILNNNDTFAYYINFTPSTTFSVISGSTTSNIKYTYTGNNPVYVYNYFKDMFLMFTSGSNNNIYRKINTYDFYNKTFITDEFPNTAADGDTFTIIIPQYATKVSSLTSSNQFTINESTGVLTFHSNDANKKVKIDYVYINRTW